MGSSTCSGFALAAGSGAKAAVNAGFIASLRAAMPVFNSGAAAYITPSGSVWALGTRLRALSMLTGSTRRSPTTAQSSSRKRLGALLTRTRSTTTARMSQDAAMPMFSVLMNTSAISPALPVFVYHALHLIELGAR